MLPVVKGAFISVCRHIYSTCEGLQVSLPYNLHESIAKAWKKASIPELLFSSLLIFISNSHYCSILLVLKYFTGANMASLASQYSNT